MLSDLASLLVEVVYLHATRSPAMFGVALAAGGALAAACWYACARCTRLWNTRFHMSVVHHVACGAAAVCTVLFVVVFGSVQHARDAALASIAAWQVQLNVDRAWADKTFAQAFQAVRALGTEDFSRVPPPRSPGAFIPTSSNQARATAAGVYANEACRHFDRARPLLSRIVWTSPGVPSETIFADVRAWHERNPNYPPARAIEIAATEVRNGLEPQVPRLIHAARLSLAVLFLLVQALVFGLVGWAAYRNITPI